MRQVLQKANNNGYRGLLISREKNEISNKFEAVINEYSDTYNKGMGYEIIKYGQVEFDYEKIKKYYKKITKKFEQIEMNDNKLSGMPVIKDTRIPVSLIVACLKDDMTIEEICKEYDVNPVDVEEAMEYVIDILDAPYEDELE